MDIKNAASQAANGDITILDGFSERQVKEIAQQAAFIAAGIASGEITGETKDFFLNGLKDMTINFTKTLIGLIEETIEKIWNAIVDVLWKAISTAAGIKI